MIDICITLNKRGIIQDIEWESAWLEKFYGKDWSRYKGIAFKDIPDIQINEQVKSIKWKKKYFAYTELVISEECRLVLMKAQNQIESLYKFALNQIGFGVQIYDQNACTVFMNQVSRDISSIPQYLDITGQHLLDIYALDEEISTVMTTLRTKSPVINRFDSFKSKEGNNIVSVNTAYPIFENHELIGAVVFEKSLPVINEEIEKLEVLKDTMKEKTSKRISTFSGYSFPDIIGSNSELLASIALAKKIAPQECNILVVGETGTGKEIFTQSIHKASNRTKSKFVAINCAAVPETLIESMFFGTTKGSFTGSVDKMGLLEEANGGTLFLDELNSMSLSMQSKLLRVIQEGYFRRVGGNHNIHVDIRFISSCNEDSGKLVDNNVLRRDLFYRLSTISIEIPPLRQRLDDVFELVQFYLTKNINRYVKTIYEVSPEVLVIFQRYQWPGNVRELFNVLDYILNTTEEGSVEVRHLPKYLQNKPMALEDIHVREAVDSSEAMPFAAHVLNTSDLQTALSMVEKEMIEKNLRTCRYNITKAAEELGVSRQNLQYRIRKLNIPTRTT